jgi:hypothetical protein
MIRMAENELSISPMEEALRQRLLSSAIKYYQSIIDETNDDADTQKGLIVTRDRAQQILAKLEFIQKGRDLQLLVDPAVQRDLGLTVAQHGVMKSIGSLSFEESSNQSLDFGSHDRLLADLKLSDTQLNRLKQISIQLQGPPGLRDLVVSGQLRLSSEQMEAIQSDIIAFISSASFSALAVQPSQPVGGDATQSTALAASVLSSIAKVLGPDKTRGIRGPEDLITPEVKSALMEVLLRRLTPEQLKKWHAITGEKFER